LAANLNILKYLTQQLKMSASPMVERCLVVAAKKSNQSPSPVFFFKLSLFVLGIPNELPELEVANSRRTSVAPTADRYAHASLRLAAMTVARLTSYNCADSSRLVCSNTIVVNVISASS